VKDMLRETFPDEPSRRVVPLHRSDCELQSRGKAGSVPNSRPETTLVGRMWKARDHSEAWRSASRAFRVADEYHPGIEPYNFFGLQPAEIAGNKFADGSDL
jgi:hypothetical protein